MRKVVGPATSMAVICVESLGVEGRGQRVGKRTAAGYVFNVGSMVRGWGLARESLRVVLADGSLAVLVVLGAIASGLVAAAVFVPAWIGWSSDRALAGILIVAGTYLTTATGVFFAVALARVRTL